MAYKIHWQKHGILTEWTEQSTSKELISMLKEVQANPRFDSIKYSIHDYRHCPNISFDPDDMDEAAALDYAAALSNPGIKVALITTHPVLIEMMEGYLQSGISPLLIKNFSDFPEALEWLDNFGIKISPEEINGQ